MISALKNVIIPRWTVQLVDVSLPSERRQHHFNSILIEPSDSIRLPQHIKLPESLAQMWGVTIPFFRYVMRASVQQQSPSIRVPRLVTLHHRQELLMVEFILPQTWLTLTSLQTNSKSYLHCYSNTLIYLLAPGIHINSKAHIYTEGPPICQPVCYQPVAQGLKPSPCCSILCCTSASITSWRSLHDLGIGWVMKGLVWTTVSLMPWCLSLTRDKLHGWLSRWLNIIYNIRAIGR